MRIYRTLAVMGLGLGVTLWLLDVASAQQRVQVQQQKRRPNPPPVQTVPPVQQQPVQQPVRPVTKVIINNPAPVTPRFSRPVNNPVNNPGTPIIGGIGGQIRSPSAGTTAIPGMSGSYLGNLTNNGYLGGFNNNNAFFNPYLGFNNPGFGNPWFGSPWGQFNTWGNSWGMNPWGNTWGNPWANPYNQFSGWGNSWGSPYNQFTGNMNVSPYGGFNPWNANPFQMAFPQNGPFAPMVPNPFMQNAFLGGGLGGFNGQVVGQQPR
jgi:hypothetical protein